MEASVAHIIYDVAPHFTGSIGPVRFVKGHGETDDPEVADWFREQPDLYTVTETDEPAPELHDLADVADEFGVELDDDTQE